MPGGPQGAAACYNSGEKGEGALTCNNTGDFSHEAFHSSDGDAFCLVLDESNNLLDLQREDQKESAVQADETPDEMERERRM